MDSELQAAFDDVRDLCDGSEPDSLHVIVEAARKYANPDMEAFHKALYEWFHSERPMSSDAEKELVDAALGVTEDKEQHNGECDCVQCELARAVLDVTEDE